MRAPYAMIGLTLLLLSPTTGCSSFNRDWRAASLAGASEPAMTGAWSGTWKSATSGHQGPLRAILTHIDDDTLRARFRARFWGIMSYSYSLELEVEPAAPGCWSFMGSADLGWLAGGVFKCRGAASADEFRADFDSKRDHGTFSLSRPTTEP